MQCIRYVRQENGGLSLAQNTGIEVRTGDYLTFIDPDDWVTEDYVKCSVANFKNIIWMFPANYNLYDDSNVILDQGNGRRLFRDPL